jgi:sulfur-oxidizing protein SoxY
MPTELLIQRRRLLQGAAAVGGAIAAGATRTAGAAPIADIETAFSARSFPEALAALGGVPKPSNQISMELPQVAENGALVPITVSSQLPGTREIMIVVDGNPQPLAVCFGIPDGTEPFVATRIRLAQTGTVYAAVRTDQGLHATARTIQVTVGGCG